jgi:hypothetical protein
MERVEASQYNEQEHDPEQVAFGLQEERKQEQERMR